VLKVRAFTPLAQASSGTVRQIRLAGVPFFW
jgi:hypothetical protein